MSVIPITPRGGTRRPPAATRSVEETALLVRILARSLGGEDAADAGNRLMRRFGSVSAAVSADRVELGRAGLAPASIADCRLARDLAVALARVEAYRQPLVSSWTELIDYLRAALAHAPREQFRTLYLDKKNRLLRDELTADGTVDHAPVFNAGPGRVERAGGVPRIPETEQYVAAVLECFLAGVAGREVRARRDCTPGGGPS